MMEPRFRFYNSPENYFLVLKHLFLPSLKSSKANQKKVLEDKLCKLSNATGTVLVPQNRFGLHLCVKHSIDKTRPKVIMPAYTIYDAVNMVVTAGGTPVFADVNENTCNVSIEDILQKIDEQTSVVIVAHLHGKLSNIRELTEVCQKKKIVVVEDYAQAFGSKISGSEPVLLADARVLSFGRAKNVNAFFGGAVISNNNELIKSIREDMGQLSNESWTTLTKRIFLCLIFDILAVPVVFTFFTTKIIALIGIASPNAANSVVQTEKVPKKVAKLPERYARNLTDLQAKLVIKQLDKIDDCTYQRRAIACYYESELKNIKQIQLPTSTMDEPHIYLQYPILMEKREEFVVFARKRGCDIPIQHLNNLPDLRVFRDYFSDCPKSRSVASKVVLLPTYPGYSMLQAKKNVAALKEFLTV